MCSRADLLEDRHASSRSKTLQWAQYLKEVTDDRNFEIVTALRLEHQQAGTTTSPRSGTRARMDEPKSSNHIEFSDAEGGQASSRRRARTFDLDEGASSQVQSAAHRRINELQPYTFLFTLQAGAASTGSRADLGPEASADQWRIRPFMRLWPLYVPARQVADRRTTSPQDRRLPGASPTSSSAC